MTNADSPPPRDANTVKLTRVFLSLGIVALPSRS